MTIQELFDLTGKVAIVTGGRGIYGQPISEALAEAGAHVIVASRDLAKCQAWVAELVGRGLQATAKQYDQSNTDSILAFRDDVFKDFDAVDVHVNNSVVRGVSHYNDDIEAWRTSMEGNAVGVFAISRAFLDPMMERGSGSMINISSIQGVVAPDFKNYEGTDMTTPPDYQFHKHGLVGLTKYLAAWAGPKGVRVNCISPGGYNPGKLTERFISQYCRRVFLGRMGEHDDIKGVALFLASEASRYLTGQNIVMDGGYCC